MAFEEISRFIECVLAKNIDGEIVGLHPYTLSSLVTHDDSNLYDVIEDLKEAVETSKDDNLYDIVNQFFGEENTNLWIQNIVQSGQAPEKLPVGTIIPEKHTKYGDLQFKVVSHNYLVPNSVTLLSSISINPSLMYDAPEAIYYCSKQLTAGSYVLEINGSKYKFNISQLIPKEGQIRWSGSMFSTYKNGYTNSMIEGEITPETVETVDEGVTLLTETNDYNKVSYGNNNYGQSVVDQWLNSSEKAGAWWKPRNKYDTEPSGISTIDGFMGGLSDSFKNIIKLATIPCVSNSIHETGMYKETNYDLKRKFYLPSITELSTYENSEGDGKTFDAYSEAVNVDRVVQNSDGSPTDYLTRTPVKTTTHSLMQVSENGEISVKSSNANTTSNIVVACTIY